MGKEGQRLEKSESARGLVVAISGVSVIRIE
jgi:hypothetical protein